MLLPQTGVDGGSSARQCSRRGARTGTSSSSGTASHSRRVAPTRAPATKTPYPDVTRQINTDAPTDVLYDAVIVGGEV
jgi:hypothetical protein